MDAPSKQSQVGNAIEGLGKEIAVLHETISNLQDRLSSIIRSEDAAKEPGQGTPVPLLVVHAQDLANMGADIARANARLRSLLSRIEL